MAVYFCAVAEGQKDNQQWLIEEIVGRWQVQEPGQPARPMAKYEVLTPACKVRCLDPVGSPCSLQAYAAPGNKVQVPLPVPTRKKPDQLQQWMDVPVPGAPPVPRMAIEMQETIGKAGVRGGVAKGGVGCSGDLPLLSPTCGETIDAADFKLEWTPRPSEAGKAFTLLVGGSDSSERKRWNLIPADAGEFQNEDTSKFLASLELPDRPTDVTLRLMRTEDLDAVRLVRLPSRADDGEYRNKLQTLSLQPELTRRLGLLDHYLKVGMWRKASEIARELLQDAPDSVEIRKYALVGFCGSDFAEEIARLRNSLADAGVSGFCEPRRDR
jgi:hypothetical protein